MAGDKDESETYYSPVQTKDEERRKFPRAVFIIVLNEFCERFSYSGMRAFLALYLKQKLFYTDDEATEIYHVFTTMAYFFAIFGAILADSYIGKYRTILYLMMIYAIGNVIISVAAIPHLELPAREFTILSLMMVALGTGGIKPCVSSFGGDQFILPQQDKQLTLFFTFLYFILCLGSVISKSVSPLLRSQIQCFGDKDCFSIAFAAPGILIIISIVMFACAKKMYIIKKPSGNILSDVANCIYEAIKNRKSKDNNEKTKKKMTHWLDNARDHYEQSFINDVKRCLRIFLLFTPLVTFWALLDQLGSRWTLQATQMDGDFGIFNLKPDQMQVLCPISLIILIPLFKKVIYPFLSHHNILTNLLHRLIAGCIFAGVAYVCAGTLELHLQKTYPVLPTPGNGQLRIFNAHNNCVLHFTNQQYTANNFSINPLEMHLSYIYLNNMTTLKYNKTATNCSLYTEEVIFTLEESKAMSYVYYNETHMTKYEDQIDKSRSRLPYLRIVTNFIDEDCHHDVKLIDVYKGITELQTNSSLSKLTEVFPGKYYVYINNTKLSVLVDVKTGGVYTIIVQGNQQMGYNGGVITVTEPNSVTMAWVLPQIVIISIGEVLFAITGLEFAFKEAPESMKAVLQAYWLLIEAFGNILIIIVTRLGSGYKQVYHFFFFAILMFVSTVIFFFLMQRYERQRSKDQQQQDSQPFNVELDMNNVTITSQHKYMELLQLDDTIDH